MARQCQSRTWLECGCVRVMVRIDMATLYIRKVRGSLKVCPAVGYWLSRDRVPNSPWQAL